MKVRLDFVTNSSSSSFIIATTKDFNIDLEQYPDLIKKIIKRHLDNFKNQVNSTINNDSDLLSFISEHYGYDDVEGFLNDPWWAKDHEELYNKIKEQLSLGNSILYFYLDSCEDEALIDFISDLVKTNTVVLLEGD